AFQACVQPATTPQNTPLDLCQIAAAQGCLPESAALNQNEIHASMILSTRPNSSRTTKEGRRADESGRLSRWLLLVDQTFADDGYGAEYRCDSSSERSSYSLTS